MQKRLIIRTVEPNMDEQLQQFNETFQTVRKERHDYLKHVAAIHHFLEQRDYKNAKSYMADILDKYEETNLSIKGEQGAIASVLHTNYNELEQKTLQSIIS